MASGGVWTAGWSGWAGSTQGENNRNAKLTDDDIREIRAKQRRGWTARRTAAKYGVSRQQIEAIWKRKRWAHVAD